MLRDKVNLLKRKKMRLREKNVLQKESSDLETAQFLVLKQFEKGNERIIYEQEAKLRKSN